MYQSVYSGDNMTSNVILISDNSCEATQQANRNSMRSLRLINLITGSSSVFQFLFLAKTQKKKTTQIKSISHQGTEVHSSRKPA